MGGEVMKLKPAGWLPDFEAMFHKFIYNIIDQYSFEAFIALSVIGGFAILFSINVINNLIATIRLNFEELYGRRSRRK
jgi:hypothetical protein